MSKRWRALIMVAIPFALTIGFSWVLQIAALNHPEKITGMLRGAGPWFLAIYALFQVLSIIIAPIGGGFMQLALIAVIGPDRAIPIIYLIATPSYLINFALAKRFGRPMVSRITGDAALEKLDDLVRDTGTPILAILKIFWGGNFDYISYAYGLTNIRFRTFAVVNIMGGIPAVFFSHYVFTRAGSLVESAVIVQIGASSFALIAIVVTQALRHNSPTQLLIKAKRGVHRIWNSIVDAIHL